MPNTLLGLALDQDGGPNPRQLAFLDKLFNVHGDGIGHLFFGRVENLLPDHLRRQRTHGLIGDRILVVRSLAFLQIRHRDGQQAIDVVVRLCGNRHDFRPGKQPGITVEHRQQFVLVDQIDLRHDENDRARPLRHRFFHMRQRRQVSRSRQTGRLHEDVENIGFVQRFDGRAHHPPVQQMLRLVEARRIEKGDLRARHVRHAQNTGPRRLRLVRYDRDLFAQQAIQQRRLADIGPTDNGDGAELHGLNGGSCCFNGSGAS
jgi:hypothetical protein